ncbi:MAG: DUF1360 domain-containing protein [Acidimicrobiales bacterium]
MRAETIGHREEMAGLSSDGVASFHGRAARRVRLETEAYRATSAGDHPLGGYLALFMIYVGYVVSLGGIICWRGRPLPERIAPIDIALLTVATHKVARIATKDPVTSPFRAAFTRFEGATGEGEIAEEVRGTGLRHAVGELVTCPFCIGQWVATFFVFSIVVAPRVTRMAATVFALLAGSDILQIAYAKAQAWVD